MEEVKAEQQREISTLKEEIAKWQETARQAETACHKLKYVTKCMSMKMLCIKKYKASIKKLKT